MSVSIMSFMFVNLTVYMTVIVKTLCTQVLSYNSFTCHLLSNTYMCILLTNHMLYYARIIANLVGFLGNSHIKCQSIKRMHQ